MHTQSLTDPNRDESPLLVRFKGYIEDLAQPDSCWIWTGATHQPNPATASRYGRFRMGARVEEAHRAAHILMVGPIPNGVTVDHLCRNTRCVNPRHLELVSQAENTRRANTKETCKRGHRFDVTTAAGKRLCSTCQRMYGRAASERRKAARRARTEGIRAY